MLTLNPLRSAITGLCLFAGIASAQAALTITFEQDDSTGHLNIILTGSQVTSFDLNLPLGGAVTGFKPTALYVGADGNRWTALIGWSLEGSIPWESVYPDSTNYSGAGGFEVSGSILRFFSSTGSKLITWDGNATYEGNLAGLGLSNGQSGSFAFSNEAETITVNWSATVIPVPEPATYALVLGLGVAGVALVRRRNASR